jgi:hypothetical protein
MTLLLIRPRLLYVAGPCGGTSSVKLLAAKLIAQHSESLSDALAGHVHIDSRLLGELRGRSESL